MSLSQAQKTYVGGSLIVGAVLAALFGILAGSSTSNQAAYIAAAAASGLAGIVSLIVLLVKRD
jgi:hypothetical protein